MSTFKWELIFKPNEETKIAIAWISFLPLPPNFFCEKAMFSLTIAVGKTLQVDMATKKKTVPVVRE